MYTLFVGFADHDEYAEYDFHSYDQVLTAVRCFLKEVEAKDMTSHLAPFLSVKHTADDLQKPAYFGIIGAGLQIQPVAFVLQDGVDPRQFFCLQVLKLRESINDFIQSGSPVKH